MDSRRAADGTIELLAPNDAAFGGGSALELVADDDRGGGFDDEPRPRWLMAVAGLVVVGLAAAGVVAAAPWNGDTVTAPITVVPPSTAPPSTVPTTGSGDGTSSGIPLPTGWVSDRPDGWRQVAFANLAPNDGSFGDQLDVWATRDATWADGTWFALHAAPQASTFLLEGGSRFAVGDRTVVMGTDPTGVTVTGVTLPLPPDEVGTPPPGYDIRSRGVPLDQLIDFVTDFVPPVPGGAIDYGDIPQLGTLLGTSLVFSAPTDGGLTSLIGSPETASIVSDDGGRTGIATATSTADATVDTVLPLLYEPVATVALASRRPASAQVTVYRDGADERLLATWIVDDQRVTVWSYRVDVDTFVAAVASARPATDDEWTQLLDDAENPPQDDVVVSSTAISGTLADAGRWTGQVNDGSFYVTTETLGWSASFDAAAPVHRFVAADVDIVLATTAPGDTARTMRVTVDGREPVDVALVEISGTGSWTGAWVDTSIVATPIHVELLDTDGVVVLSDQG